MAADANLLSSSFRYLRFSLALPLFTLLIAILCVGSVLPRMIRVSRAARQRTTTVESTPSIDLSIIADFYSQSEKSRRWALPDPLKAVALLNIPSMFGEMAISLPTTWPESWHPNLSFPFDGLWFWRAITWPIYALPLWWLGGRTIDALRDRGRFPFRPRIRLVEAIAMGLIGAFSCILGIGLLLDSDPDGLRDGMRWVFVPALLWFSFGLLSVIAWVKQKRVKASTS